MSIPISARLAQKVEKSGNAIPNKGIGGNWVCAKPRSLRDFSQLLQPPGQTSRFVELFNAVMGRQESEPIMDCTDRFCVSGGSVFNELSIAENGQIMSEYTFLFIHSFSFPSFSCDNHALKTGAPQQQVAQSDGYFVYQRLASINRHIMNQ